MCWYQPRPETLFSLLRVFLVLAPKGLHYCQFQFLFGCTIPLCTHQAGACTMKQDLELAHFRLNPVVAAQCSGSVLVIKAPSSDQFQRRRYWRAFSKTGSLRLKIDTH